MRNISLVFQKFFKAAVVLLALSFSMSDLYAQDVKSGQTIFRQKCASCHRVFGNLTGPELAGVNERREEEWLVKWIKNAPAMIAAGDPIALELDAQYPNAMMNAMLDLSDSDIKDVLAFVKSEEEKKAAGDAGGSGGGDGSGAASSDKSNMMLLALGIIILLAFGVILVLNRVIRTLEKIIATNKTLLPEPAVATPPRDFKQVFGKYLKNKKLVFFVVLMLVGLLGSMGWKTMWNVGVHEGYMPVQPIKFSHQLHAGVNQIDCQYCHGGAYKSKNASIPSANVCMNCHTAVTGSEQYGGEISPEILKIYRALDYNPETQEYGNNPKPIEWVRIHNLPDFAYFNHSQHVVVAGVACETCHGPVDTMEELYQYSPLTMKWCIDCHMTTEVDADNAYYDQLIAAHEKLKRGEKVTAALIGGLECGKCHY